MSFFRIRVEGVKRRASQQLNVRDSRRHSVSAHSRGMSHLSQRLFRRHASVVTRNSGTNDGAMEQLDESFLHKQGAIQNLRV